VAGELFPQACHHARHVLSFDRSSYDEHDLIPALTRRHGDHLHWF
jgi:hypothetical protein